MRYAVLLLSLVWGVLGIPFGSSRAFAFGPEGLHRCAREAYRKAERDLDWLLKTGGETLRVCAPDLEAEVKRLKRAFACATLDWKKFKELGGPVPGETPGYVSPAASAPSARELDEVLAFFEKARRRFFARKNRELWDTLLFLETRALCERLKADRLLRSADEAFLAELKKADSSKDLGRALVALYHLRRFREVLLLARRLGELSGMEPEKAARVLQAVRGSLAFLGKDEKELSAEIAAALVTLGGKGEEVGRPVLYRPGFFIGSRADLARVANVLAVVERTWKLSGRAKVLSAFVAASCALSAGDSEFAFPLFRKARSAGLSDYLGCLIESAAGVCMESLGRYDEAFAAFDRARRLARRNGSERFAVTQTVNLVSVLLALNRFVDAEKLLRKSLKEVRRPQEELWVRFLLGNVKYFRARDLAPTGPLTPLAARSLGDAEIIYTRALERLREVPEFEEKEYLKALLFTNLGNVKRRQALAASDTLRRKGLLREALTWTDKALEAARRAGRDRLSVVAGANRAEIALDLGDVESAVSFAEWALRASKVLNYFEAAWRAELYLGRAAELKGDLAAAAERYRSAVEIVETYRRRLSDETLRSSFLFNKVEAYQSLVRVLLRSGKTEEAFTVAERAKSRTVLESLGLKELNESLGKNKPDLARLVNLLRRTSITAGSRSSPFAEPVSFDSLRKEIAELMNKIGKLKKGTPALVFLFGDSPSASSILDSLKGDEVLIEYFPIGKSLAVWKIDRGGVEAHELPGTWRETARKVARFVEGKVEDRKLAEELGATLLAPLPRLLSL